MQRRVTSNSVKAGVYVVLMLLGGIAMAITVGGGLDRLKSRTEYNVRFTIEGGAKGIKPGSSVLLGGLDVGKVTAVRYLWADDAADMKVPAAILVTVGVDADIGLYQDAELQLEIPILGSVSTLNITSVGTKQAGVLAPGSEIKASNAPGLLAQIGVQEDQVKAIVADLQETTRKIREDWAPYVDRVLANVETITADGKQIVADSKGPIADGVNRFPRIMESAQKTVTDAEAFIAKLDNAAVTMQAYLDENRGDVRAAVESARRLTEQVEKELYPKVTRFADALEARADEARTLLASTQAMIDRGNLILAENQPELRQSIANIRLATDQLKLTLTDVRRNPWKLLYQPARKELQQDLLFMSARTYAEAVSDLRGASTSLETVVSAAQSVGKPADAEVVTAMLARVSEAFARYEKAERQLIERLSREGDGDGR